MSVRIISDPLKNIVYLPSEYNLDSYSADCLDEDIALILQTPAIIITVYDPQPELYHYRPVGWNLALMFKSVKEENHWIVTDCIQYPSVEMLQELLNKGNLFTFRS